MKTVSRRKMLMGLIALPAGAAVLLRSPLAHATHYQAMLCGSCSFGNKKDNCVHCGKWMGSTKYPARLCSDHGFGNKKDNCASCGKWIGSTRELAYVGNCCGFGNKKENCVICGKWAS
jgi:hypothetical protein